MTPRPRRDKLPPLCHCYQSASKDTGRYFRLWASHEVPDNIVRALRVWAVGEKRVKLLEHYDMSRVVKCP